jgi:hypothetical protein
MTRREKNRKGKKKGGGGEYRGAWGGVEEDFAIRVHAEAKSEKNLWIRTIHLLVCYQAHSRFVFIQFYVVFELPQ